jgi:hypothetical protein
MDIGFYPIADTVQLEEMSDACASNDSLRLLSLSYTVLLLIYLACIQIVKEQAQRPVSNTRPSA